MSTDVRVRFAPSPTGHLHIGGLRTALFNELFARQHGGSFLLRIEDTDRERSRKEYTDSILSSLVWAGITWDEEPVIQSERLKEHQAVIQQLLREEKAYRCYCTIEELAQRCQVLHIDGTSFSKYDGKCWKERPKTPSLDVPYAVRFRLPEGRNSVIFNDLIRGQVEFKIEQLDDFIIARSDGWPMYNFVVVVDDASMRITHVIRGEDHISNTPKQILLYEACGYPLPYFAHMPLILGPTGQRLSKRDAATAVTDYRHRGYLPQALVNYLARLGWAYKDQEIFSKQELMQYFSLEAVGKKGAIFNQDKLDWLNSMYLKSLDAPTILALILKDVAPDFKERTSLWTDEQRYALIDLYKVREKVMGDIVTTLFKVYIAPTMYDSQALAQWITSDTLSYLETVLTILDTHEETATHTIKIWCEAHGIKLVSVMQPVRIALLGSSAGPGVFDLIDALGVEETKKRLQAFIAYLSRNPLKASV